MSNDVGVSVSGLGEAGGCSISLKNKNSFFRYV
jgi:hypothetical protein